MTMEEMRDYQLAQLELIEMMDKLCSELKLTYYIIGGTLLGAVRHGGFIPWDPDIDIAMPRNDYEKVRKYFAENESERYFYDHYSTEKNHLQPHALIRIKSSHVILNSYESNIHPKYDGIYLDIFPLDNPPEDQKLQEKQAKKIKHYRKLIYMKDARAFSNTGTVKKLLKRGVSLMLAPFSFRYLNKKMDKVMQKYNRPDATHLVSMASHYSYKKQYMQKEIYGTPTRISYENMSLCAPEKTHEYLVQIFGDYMKLPPEDQRQFMLNIFARVEYDKEENHTK